MILRLLKAADLTSNDTRDRWESGSATEGIANSRTFVTDYAGQENDGAGVWGWAFSEEPQLQNDNITALSSILEYDDRSETAQSEGEGMEKRFQREVTSDSENNNEAEALPPETSQPTSPYPLDEGPLSSVKRLLENSDIMNGSRSQAGEYAAMTHEQKESVSEWIGGMVKDSKFFSKAIVQITQDHRVRKMLYDRAVAHAEARLISSAGFWSNAVESNFTTTADCDNRIRDKERVERDAQFEEKVWMVYQFGHDSR